VRPGIAVLIADGYLDAADSLGLLLTLAGHRVRTTYTGPEALDLAYQDPPDVLVCDLVLPQLNGYELARRLRPKLPRTLFVALTGLGSKADHEASSRAGFDCHLVKPVEPSILLRLLVHELARKRS
jgi:two-component system CheB/CheR fusion protein